MQKPHVVTFRAPERPTPARYQRAFLWLAASDSVGITAWKRPGPGIPRDPVWKRDSGRTLLEVVRETAKMGENDGGYHNAMMWLGRQAHVWARHDTPTKIKFSWTHDESNSLLDAIEAAMRTNRATL